jgi:hypothetical protein
VTWPAAAASDAAAADHARKVTESSTGGQGAGSSADDADGHVELDQDGVASADRDQVLGDEWDRGNDEANVVLNDADGVTVLTAQSSDGYAWNATAVLPTPVTDTDLWVSNSCVTSSGDYMAVVYAPRSVTNDEDAFGGGARAAIVDLESGEVSDLGAGYTISYFNPGCGVGDTVTITRFEPGYTTTRIAVVDAASAAVRRTTAVDGLVTSAVSEGDGTVLAARGGQLLSIAPQTDEPAVLTSGAGSAYDLAVDGQNRLAYVTSEDGGQSSTAYVTSLGSVDAPRAIGTGPATETGVQAAQDGGFYLTGEGVHAELAGVPGVVQLPAAGPGATISSNGAFVVDEVAPEGSADVPSPGGPEDAAVLDVEAPQITATAVETGATLTFSLDEAALSGPRESAPTEDGSGDSTERVPGSDTGPATLAQENRPTAAAVAGSPTNPVEDERYCSVPRNDPNNQAYQPKPRQVEWAVDRAVKGELTQARPANWRNLGMPAYSPQALFPKRELVGGGTIPPQIVLGVLAQESNLWQASRFTAPGNTGNPLIGDYYGTRSTGSIWEIDYTEADCGYGIGQITDGMRVSGHPRVDDETGLPIESALPEDKQRAIALDYTVNIAKAVQMLGDKWNELAHAGLLVNDGDSGYIENWFLTTWAYNSGFHPDKGDGSPWGVGWFNNPISTVYNPARSPFLETQADAAHPQDWPYPEKITGWAAYGASLVETQYADPATRTYKSQMVSSFRTAWWNGDDYRALAKPPVGQFCDLGVNDCDPYDSEPCQLSSYECWWHAPVVWKDAADCDLQCGHGFERFPSSYATEASSMASSLPALTLRSSYLPDCQNPPSGVVVVDDTTHLDARNTGECAHRSTVGSFQFTFGAPDPAGQYPAKVDLHQQGGGFNGHFSFAHMQDKTNTRARVTGTWSRGADMTGTWTRVWVHLPDYAGWTQQAGYTINLGDGTSQTRYLQQRHYANEWVSLGVFQMKGVPSVSLTNALVDPDTTRRYSTPGETVDIAGYDDVAWDSVGFQALPAKPQEFVVALGDSYGSGEGAGSYAPWSDNNGELLEANNSCHQSANAWIRKTTIPGSTVTIGSRADSASPDMDFHFLACSGAQTEDLLPYYSAGPTAPVNADGENGAYSQAGMVSQLDAGYLDANTTLVTVSIGGNDMRFSDIIAACVQAKINPLAQTHDCAQWVLGGDTQNVVDASADRLENDLPASLATVLGLIRERAPSARIALAGYPKLFESGSECVEIKPAEQGWLNEFADSMNQSIREAAEAANTPGTPAIFYVDTQSRFTGHNLCTGQSGINGLQFTVTPAEDRTLPFLGILVNGQFVSRTSVHPNDYGTSLYSQALEDALALHP